MPKRSAHALPYFGGVRSRRMSSSELYAVANKLCGEFKSYEKWIGIDWFDPKNLAKLIMLASNDVHGGLQLTVDGDCFVPPECWCFLSGWCFTVNKGAGGTPNEAILRALRIREIRSLKYRETHKDNLDDQAPLP